MEKKVGEVKTEDSSMFQKSLTVPSSEDRAKISQKLKEPLEEEISTRAGPGGAKKCVEIANEIFGFDGWSCSIEKKEILFCENNNGRWSVACSATMKISLAAGASHTDVGFGDASNMKSRGDAMEKALKQAVSDARKRTLRIFGSKLGNCLYDRKHTEKIKKRKLEAGRKLLQDIKTRKHTAQSKSVQELPTTHSSSAHIPRTKAPTPKHKLQKLTSFPDNFRASLKTNSNTMIPPSKQPKQKPHRTDTDCSTHKPEVSRSESVNPNIQSRKPFREIQNPAVVGVNKHLQHSHLKPKPSGGSGIAQIPNTASAASSVKNEEAEEENDDFWGNVDISGFNSVP
eukprot:maker-scaffold_13-snap-gene-11.2-mRNA-1 protein AED:0.01 eAED:0.01 QI:86/0.5/0.66/1/1/1/3/211/341